MAHAKKLFCLFDLICFSSVLLGDKVVMAIGQHNVIDAHFVTVHACNSHHYNHNHQHYHRGCFDPTKIRKEHHI